MRRRIYEIIEVSEDGDSLSKAYDIFMMMCIIASLVPLAFKEQNGVFNVMDWITTIIFVGDYMLRLFTADYKLGKGKEMVDRLTNLVAIFEDPELDFGGNGADGDDILGDAYEYLISNYAANAGKSGGEFFTPQHVSKLIARLAGSLNKNFVLEKFCEQEQCSERALRQHFRTLTGMTVNHYLRQLRICHAQYLLQHTEWMVSDVAMRCGFEDSNYFSVVFTRETGMTPSQWRHLSTQHA